MASTLGNSTSPHRTSNNGLNWDRRLLTRAAVVVAPLELSRLSSGENIQRTTTIRTGEDRTERKERSIGDEINMQLLTEVTREAMREEAGVHAIGFPKIGHDRANLLLSC